jgi:hypothetical protein
MEQGYISPQLVRIGSLAELTLVNGGAYGKGSTTPDGKSGLIGNRSGG